MDKSFCQVSSILICGICACAGAANPNMVLITVPAIIAIFEIVGRNLVFAEPASHRV
jgi:hypothetical protein